MALATTERRREPLGGWLNVEPAIKRATFAELRTMEPRVSSTSESTWGPKDATSGRLEKNLE